MGLTKFSGCVSGAGCCTQSGMPMVRHECNAIGARPSHLGRLVRKSMRESGRTTVTRDPRHSSVRRSFGSDAEHIRLDPAAGMGIYFRPVAERRASRDPQEHNQTCPSQIGNPMRTPAPTTTSACKGSLLVRPRVMCMHASGLTCHCFSGTDGKIFNIDRTRWSRSCPSAYFRIYRTACSG